MGPAMGSLSSVRRGDMGCATGAIKLPGLGRAVSVGDRSSPRRCIVVSATRDEDPASGLDQVARNTIATVAIRPHLVTRLELYRSVRLNWRLDRRLQRP